MRTAVGAAGEVAAGGVRAAALLGARRGGVSEHRRGGEYLFRLRAAAGPAGDGALRSLDANQHFGDGAALAALVFVDGHGSLRIIEVSHGRRAGVGASARRTGGV